MNRRQFLHTTTGAASGLLLLKSATAFGYQANSAVRLGLLGCGSRGTAVATSFSQNTSAQVVALADLFLGYGVRGRPSRCNDPTRRQARSAFDYRQGCGERSSADRDPGTAMDLSFPLRH